MYPQRSVMTCGLATALEPPHFNPRTRVGCDMRPCWRAWETIGRFNPRTRVGCDHMAECQQAVPGCVSIHAPAWGATPMAPSFCARPMCFNPRTRVGCDARRGGRNTRPGSFNPRTRVGCDDHRRVLEAVVAVVSIHAPAWGATMWGRTLAVRLMRFNPRTRVGCDAGQGDATSPAGIVSIHAPAWGAT